MMTTLMSKDHFRNGIGDQFDGEGEVHAYEEHYELLSDLEDMTSQRDQIPHGLDHGKLSSLTFLLALTVC
jgi:hypothetical protein